MKNRHQLLLLSLLLPLLTQAQHFRVGLSLNRALTGNLVSNAENVPGAVEDEVKAFENSSWGYSAALFAQYAFSPRASLQVGLGYAQTGYKTRKTKIVFGQPDPTALEYYQFSWIHRDLVVPVLYRYNLSKRKHNFYLISGLTPQIKLQRLKTQHQWYADGRETETTESDKVTGFRNLNVNGTFGIGYDLQLLAKMHLFFQPTFDFNILGATKAALNRRIYSLGLNLGLIIG